MSLTACEPGYNHLLTHNKAASSGKEQHEGGVEHEGRGWVSFCVCFSASLSVWIFVCTAVAPERKERGAVPGERCGLCPAAFGTKGLLLLCMLAVSVGDKVWSWEIRSGPANETHAEGLHWKKKQKTSCLDFTFLFSSASFSPLFPHVGSFACNNDLQHLHEWKLKWSEGRVKVIFGLIRTDLLKYSSSAREGTLLERGWFFVYMCVCCECSWEAWQVEFAQVMGLVQADAGGGACSSPLTLPDGSGIKSARLCTRRQHDSCFLWLGEKHIDSLPQLASFGKRWSVAKILSNGHRDVDSRKRSASGEGDGREARLSMTQPIFQL